MRNFYLRIHLVLAISAGLIFSLLGLSGSLITFYREFDRFLNPEFSSVSPGSQSKSVEELMGIIQSAHPTRTAPWKVILPTDPSVPLRADYPRPVEKEGELWAPLMVSINPYTGEIIGSRFWGETLMTWIYDLHAELQLDKFGWDLVGYSALALLVSLGTGLYLWYPRQWKSRSIWWFKSNGSNSRKLYDLHRLAGIYFFIPLAILSVSGFYFTHPAKVKPIVKLIYPIREAPKDLKSEVVPGKQSLTLDQAISVARQHLPQGDVRQVMTPGGVDGVYKINVREPGSYALNHPISSIWLDQYSGKPLAILDKKSNNLGESTLDLLWPLHREIGEFLGMPGRILYFISGLGPMVLFITGIKFLRKKRKSLLFSNMAQGKLEGKAII
jgi:uncharacterized iron-regulated membrane protein